MASWTKTQIRERAERLLRLCGVDKPPVPVERLAHRLGVQVRYEPFEGELSGVLLRDGDQVIIGVNALHPKTRQRFTIAHEIGHLELSETSNVHVDRNFRVQRRDEVSSQAVDREEVAANAFAAELLMPVNMLQHDLMDQALDYEADELLGRLADGYKVSLQAMAFRLTNLGLIRQD